MIAILQALAVLGWCVPLAVWEAKRPLGHWDALGTWPDEWKQDRS